MTSRPAGQLLSAGQLGELVRTLRRRRGWSVMQLARRSGYDRRTIQRIEVGLPYCVQTAQEVLQALGIAMQLEIQTIISTTKQA